MPQTSPINLWKALLVIVSIAVSIVLIAWSLVINDQVKQPAAKQRLPSTVTISGTIINYDQTPIQDVMRAITYFYKIPVVYEGNIPTGTLSASVNPNLKIEGMLKMLQKVGVKTEYDGKRIVVL